MPFVLEVQITSSGFPGGPGYTNLYFDVPVLGPFTTQFNAAFAWLQSLDVLMPTTWLGQVNPIGRVLEATSGALATFATAPVDTITPVAGTAGTSFGSGVSGLVVGWHTATINRARVVRGRTFVVPLSSTTYDPNGTLTSWAITQATLGANNLIASGSGFSVWSRPRLGTGGKAAPVLTTMVNDRVAFLSSRRT